MARCAYPSELRNLRSASCLVFSYVWRTTSLHTESAWYGFYTLALSCTFLCYKSRAPVGPYICIFKSINRRKWSLQDGLHAYQSRTGKDGRERGHLALTQATFCIYTYLIYHSRRSLSGNRRERGVDEYQSWGKTQRGLVGLDPGNMGRGELATAFYRFKCATISSTWSGHFLRHWDGLNLGMALEGMESGNTRWWTRD